MRRTPETLSQTYDGLISCRVIPAFKNPGFKPERTHRITMVAKLEPGYKEWKVSVSIFNIVDGIFTFDCSPKDICDADQIAFEKAVEIMKAHFQNQEDATAKSWSLTGSWSK